MSPFAPNWRGTEGDRRGGQGPLPATINPRERAAMNRKYPPRGWKTFGVSGPTDPAAGAVALLAITTIARPLRPGELARWWPYLEQAAAKRRLTPCVISRWPQRRTAKIVWLPGWLATRAIPERSGIAALVPEDARQAIMEAIHDPERRQRIQQARDPVHRRIVHS